MDLASLRTTLFKLLPVLLLMMVVLGIAIVVVRNVLPSWKNYTAVSSAVETQRAVVGTQLADQNNNDNIVILSHQITSVAQDLNTAGNSFLTQSEAEQVLNRLYDYAYSRGVRVTNLQAQPAPQTANGTSAAPYNTTTFQLEVAGGVANLIDFIAHFHDASLPSVSILTMSVASTGDQAQLTMTIMLYTSPYASGQALSQLPTSLPTLEPTSVLPTDTPIPPTETPTAVPTATVATEVPPTVAPTSTPTSTLTPSLTPTATFTPASTDTSLASETEVVCPGAPPTLLKMGDIAVVVFKGVGALRVLSDPNGSVMTTRTQAYDKQRLEVIAGPVCANNAYYWYIRNLSQNNALGWVAEGQGTERWLCPESKLDCAS